MVVAVAAVRRDRAAAADDHLAAAGCRAVASLVAVKTGGRERVKVAVANVNRSGNFNRSGNWNGRNVNGRNWNGRNNRHGGNWNGNNGMAIIGTGATGIMGIMATIITAIMSIFHRQLRLSVGLGLGWWFGAGTIFAYYGYGYYPYGYGGAYSYSCYGGGGEQLRYRYGGNQYGNGYRNGRGAGISLIRRQLADPESPSCNGGCHGLAITMDPSTESWGRKRGAQSGRTSKTTITQVNRRHSGHADRQAAIIFSVDWPAVS